MRCTSWIVLGLACIVALSMAGCGGSSLQSSIDELTTQAFEVDLDTGAVTRLQAQPSASQAADAKYRDRYVLIRVMPTDGTAIDAPASPLNPGAVPSSAQYGTYGIGMFELTRAQWTRLASRANANSASTGFVASTAPWAVPALAPYMTDADATGSGAAACGISREQAEGVLRHGAGFINGLTLRLPSPVEWEAAARAGSTQLFWWGSSGNLNTASSYVICADTSSGRRGPQAIGLTAPNTFGCYDTLGNVAEWTSGVNQGGLRGGSWYEDLNSCRVAAPGPQLDYTTAYPLAGVRVAVTVQ